MRRHARSSADRFLRRLRRSVPALLAVAAALVVCGGFVLMSVSLHATSPVQIALVAREGALAQKVAAMSSDLGELEPAERLIRVQEIQSTVDTWRARHASLVASSRSELLDAVAGEQALEHHMLTLDELLGHIDADTRELVELAATGELTRTRAADIGARLALSGRLYTYTLDHIDLRRASSMQDALEWVRLVGGISIIASGGVIALLVLALLRPSRRVIAHQIEELEGAAEELRQRKRLLAQLYIEADRRHSDRELVFAEVSHDLRSPLGAIALAATMARRKLPDTAAVLHHLELIRKSCERANGLLHQTLEQGRRDAGYRPSEWRAVAPREVLEGVVERFRPQARRKRLSLKLRADETVPAELHTDPDKLERVLENLVGNAVKYTDRGRIEVVASASADGGEDRMLAIEVRDSGIGIGQDDLERVFAAYERGSPENDGFGLGLPIAKRLVTQLDGTLTAASELGRGTTFTVRLPVAPRRPASSPSTRDMGIAEAIQKTRALEGASALVVDGDADVRRVVGDFLDGSGADVAMTGSGEQALALARERADAGTPFDCIFVDLELPDRSGYEVCEMLRARGIDASIIALTRAPLPGGDRVRTSGFDGALVKPLSQHDIAEKLAAFHTSERDTAS